MTIPEKAAQFMIDVAKDDSHGYDQTNRWGPDYDCSSLIIAAYKYAGVPLQSTYTGNMRSDFFAHGFTVPVNVNLATGAGLQVGDVLLNERQHTAMFVGNGNVVHATGNEYGGATGGKTGDQTGREICITPYFNFSSGWDYVLRYSKKEDAPGTYTVNAGDSLWSIAEKTLGDGSRYKEIQALNNINGTMIYPGQILKIPTSDSETVSVTLKKSTLEKLRSMAQTSNKSIGEIIDDMVK